MKKRFLLLLLLPASLAFGQTPAVAKLLSKNGCATCHFLEKKLIGPSWVDIAARGYSKKKLTQLVYHPEPANWPGYVPMQSMPQVPKAELDQISGWIVSLKTKN